MITMLDMDRGLSRLQTTGREAWLRSVTSCLMRVLGVNATSILIRGTVRLHMNQLLGQDKCLMIKLPSVRPKVDQAQELIFKGPNPRWPLPKPPTRRGGHPNAWGLSTSMQGANLQSLAQILHLVGENKTTPCTTLAKN